MDQLIQTLKNFGAIRLLVVASIIISVGSGIHYLLDRSGSPEMSLLYANLDLSDAGKVVSKVESMGIKAEIRGGGTEVYVPAGNVARLRMDLAEAGLPRGGSIGYEIFDKDEGLGTSSFVQDINRLRALEGEIARSISTLAQVSSARVHLVLPRRELFSRDRQEPSASIVLSLKGPGSLNHNRVQAIQSMVASAVPGLSPEKVSIVDDRGNLLARGDNDSEVLSATSLEEMRTGHENRLSRMIEGLVEKNVGPGKVRAEVAVAMNFDRINTQTEKYDPDGQVARSTQTIKENDSSTEAAKGGTGTQGELPKGQTGAGGESGQSASNRSEETINYEITKSIENHTREVGNVERLSVAVMVDGVYTPGKNPGDQPTYADRPKEELDKITTLVKNAIGFNKERGDTVEVVNMRFAPVEPEGVSSEEPSMFSLSHPDIVRLVEAGIVGLFGLLMLMMVVKPVIIRLLEGVPQTPKVEDALINNEVVAAQTPPSNLNAANTPPEAERPPLPGPNNKELDRMLSLQQVEGKVRESSLKQITGLIEEKPTDAVNVVREWMHERS